VRRRALLRLVGATAATSVAWPLRLDAQQRSRPALVGIFTTADASGRGLVPAETDAFHQAMRDLGLRRGAKHFISLPLVLRPISDFG